MPNDKRKVNEKNRLKDILKSCLNSVKKRRLEKEDKITYFHDLSKSYNYDYQDDERSGCQCLKSLENGKQETHVEETHSDKHSHLNEDRTLPSVTKRTDSLSDKWQTDERHTFSSTNLETSDKSSLTPSLAALIVEHLDEPNSKCDKYTSTNSLDIYCSKIPETSKKENINRTEKTVKDLPSFYFVKQHVKCNYQKILEESIKDAVLQFLQQGRKFPQVKSKIKKKPEVPDRFLEDELDFVETPTNKNRQSTSFSYFKRSNGRLSQNANYLSSHSNTPNVLLFKMALRVFDNLINVYEGRSSDSEPSLEKRFVHKYKNLKANSDVKSPSEVLSQISTSSSTTSSSEEETASLERITLKPTKKLLTKLSNEQNQKAVAPQEYEQVVSVFSSDSNPRYNEIVNINEILDVRNKIPPINYCPSKVIAVQSQTQSEDAVVIKTKQLYSDGRILLSELHSYRPDQTADNSKTTTVNSVMDNSDSKQNYHRSSEIIEIKNAELVTSPEKTGVLSSERVQEDAVSIKDNASSVYIKGTIENWGDIISGRTNNMIISGEYYQYKSEDDTKKLQRNTGNNRVQQIKSTILYSQK